jgi:hypothetical protein
MILQDFKDENFGKKLKRKCCGKTEEMETHCPSNDITTENSRNSRTLSKTQ